MTYLDRIQVVWYVKFTGVATKFASASSWAGSSNVEACLAGEPVGTGGRLDRSRGIVPPNTFSISVMDTPTVRSLFGRRGGTQAYLTESITPTATTVKISNTGLAGTTVYIDQETITLGSHAGSGTYNGCTRAVEDSRGTAHIVGAIVSTRPRHWLGRRAQLFEVSIRRGDIATETATATARATGELRTSPTFTDGVYEMTFVEPANLMARRIYVGWNEVPAVFNARSVADRTITYDVSDAREFSIAADSHVRMDFDDGVTLITPLDKDDVTRANNRVTVSTDPADVIVQSGEIRSSETGRLHTAGQTDRIGVLSNATMRTVAVLDDDPAAAALRVMLSEWGDGANHATYDDLAGVRPDVALTTQDMVGKRLGAGLPAAWVDVSAWEDLIGASVGGGQARFYFDESTTLLDFLTNEINWRLGGYVYVNGSGQLSFARFDPATASSSLPVYDDEDYLAGPVSVVDDEEEIIGSAEIEHDYDIIQRQFRGKTSVLWTPTHNTWPGDRPSLRIASRSLLLKGGPTEAAPHLTPIHPDAMLTMLDRIYSRTRNGVRRITFPLFWSQIGTFAVGYRFKLTHPDAPDSAGSLGFTQRSYEVVGITPGYETGMLVVEAEEVPLAKLIVPSAFVASWDSGTLTITLETSATHEKDLFDSSPAHDFPTRGSRFRIRDASASPRFSVSEIETGDVTGANTIVLDAPPAAFTIADGDLVELAFGANTTDTADNTNADVQDHLFLADAGTPPLIDAGGANETAAFKWE